MFEDDDDDSGGGSNPANALTQVAAVKVPSLHEDVPDIEYKVLHVGWHVEPLASVLAQSPTPPFVGAEEASHGAYLIVVAPLVNVTPVVDVRPCALNSVTRDLESVAASKSSCLPTEDVTASFKTSTTNSTSTPTTVCMSWRRLEVASTFVILITRTFVGLVEIRLAIAATKATFSASVKLSSV